MQYRQMDIRDAEEVIAGAAQLIDVREPHEFGAGSLPAARNIPLGQLGDRLDEVATEGTVVLLCRSGNRSGRAAELLVEHGRPDVVDLTGGLMALGLAD